MTDMTLTSPYLSLSVMTRRAEEGFIALNSYLERQPLPPKEFDSIVEDLREFAGCLAAYAGLPEPPSQSAQHRASAAVESNVALMGNRLLPKLVLDTKPLMGIDAASIEKFAQLHVADGSNDEELRDLARRAKGVCGTFLSSLQLVA